MAIPKSTPETIPVIDISNPSKEVAQQVLDAASTHGFLYIKSDGLTISTQDIDNMFNLSRDFFNSPLEQRKEYAIHSEKAGGINRGWVSMQGESLDPDGQKDPKEAFNIAPPHPTLQPLPHPLSTHAPLISRFQTSCQTLCQTLLSLLNIALEISPHDYFTTRHDQSLGPSGTIFRLLYYPPSSQPPTTPTTQNAPSIRAGAHSDYGTLTLLFRLPGQPGLELLTPRGWIPVPVNPFPDILSHPPILVNIGDLLSFWTNGLLKSTVHRVVFQGQGGEERYSMAYFCHPLDSVELGGLPSRVIEGFGEEGREELEGQRRRLGLREGEGEVLTARGHLERRLKVTYGI
ncbi:hypothetical protein NX059_010908 [Plenodomus lindquistii]|nr:hypothetical protein NX059_010908 [Plenodomus lindquistii]